MKQFLLNRHIAILLIAFLLVQLATLFIFHLNYTDSDQTIMWLAALDMFQGDFYTPTFYGQQYNSHLESILAIPFLFFGIPVFKAVPIATFLLFNIPFIWLMALVSKHKKNMVFALLIILLLLPIEWHFFMGLSRGFITGLSLTMIGINIFLWKQRGWSAALCGFFILSGFFQNPNVIILLFILVIYVWLEKLYIPQKSIILWFLLGSVIATLYPIWVYIFHLENFHYIIHVFPETVTSLFVSKIFLANINDFFKLYAPFLYEAPYIFLIFFIGLGVLLYRNKNINGFIIFSILIFVIIGLSFYNKMIDGTSSIFFSYGRMFITLPFIFALLGSFLLKNDAIHSQRKIILFLTIFCSFHALAKIGMVPGRAKRAMKTNSGVVQVMKINELKSHCLDLWQEYNEKGAEGVVFISKNDMLNYGCPCFYEQLKTIHPRYERRRWVWEYFYDEKLNTIIAFDDHFILDSNKFKKFKKNDLGSWFLIDSMNMTLSEGYKWLNLNYYQNEQVIN